MNLLSLGLIIVISACGLIKEKDRSKNNADLTPQCRDANNKIMTDKTFPSPDGCNTCSCSKDGSVMCTERACVPTEFTECLRADAEFTAHVQKLLEDDKYVECSQASDCEFRNLGTMCQKIVAVNSDAFKGEVDKKLTDLRKDYEAACANKPAACDATAPPDTLVCANNMCSGVYSRSE